MAAGAGRSMELLEAMANAGVVASMNKLLDMALSRQMAPTEFDEQFHDHVSALEGLNGDDVRQIRDLTRRFVLAAFATHDYPGESSDVIASEIRSWLSGVPR